jgi:hypothetical protein
MALTGIVNLADRLVNQSQPQAEQTSADNTPTTGQRSSTSKSPPPRTAADEFALSAQTPAAGMLNLGVEEISVTLNNSLGQRAHVHVAQSGSNKNSTSSSFVCGIPRTKSVNA